MLRAYIPECIYNYINKRQPLKEKTMEFINQIYGFLSFLRPYKFLIMGVSFALFIMCIVLAYRARRNKKESVYDE